MEIRFKELKLTNFKNHQDLSLNFGELTQITGDNRKGKTSISEAISYLLYGVDTFGSKLDPSPTTYEADSTEVSLALTVDGAEHTLTRELKKGKTSFTSDEVPVKATEFNDFVESYFEKDLFLSLFNPLHFFTLHWEEQRSMILQYSTPPANKEVFKELPAAQGDKLAELVKKKSLDDLEKQHKKSKTQLEKEHIAAQSRTKTLKEQLQDQKQKIDDAGVTYEDLEKLKTSKAELEGKIKVADEKPAAAAENNKAYDKIKADLNMAQYEVDRSKEQWPSVRDEEIQDTCNSCGQKLTDAALFTATDSKNKRKEDYKAKHSALAQKRDELKEKLAGLTYIDATEASQRVRELEKELDAVISQKNAINEYAAVSKKVQEAEKSEKEKLANYKESVFILDAIKAFRAKEAELQVQKVQGLFTSISVQLFRELKNGDRKPHFEIAMDGKEYSKLSLSEKIVAGLELREVLSEQSEITAPCFVDNSESITSFKEPSGQLIVLRVVKDKELEVSVNG